MNKHTQNEYEFLNDLYDLMGMNTNFVKQKEFYYKYVENDNAFMLDEDTLTIYMDDYDIIIKPKH